tara:strand:- start:912 stop:3812 length:2901 start_codon:yes stop_codon:yes gene_type:complete
MAYNLLGQQGPKGDRNPDPNLTDAQATYLYDTPPGQGDNKGVTGTGKPVDQADVKEKLEEVGEPIRFTDGDDEETVVTTTTNNVSNAQTLLKNAGFNPGVIDGINGPNTKAAAEAYINASRGQNQLNKRRREVGFILGIDAPTTTTTTTKETITLFDKKGKPVTGIDPDAVDDMIASGLFFKTPEEANNTSVLYDKDGKPIIGIDPDAVQGMLDSGLFFRTPEEATGQTITGGKTFNDLLAGIEFGPSISADATSYEVDKINAELGITNTAFGSALNRAQSRINNGLFTSEDYGKLTKSIGTAWIEMMNADNSVAARLGSFLNLAATAAGVTGKAIGVAMEEVFGAGLNALYDIVEPDVGGSADAFIDAALGKPGENVFSDWWIDKYGTLRYDAFTNSMVDVQTGETVASIGDAEGDEETQQNNQNTIPTAPGGTTPGGAAETTEPDLAYNAIGQLGPRGESNEGYEYKFDDPPGRGFNPGVSKIGDPDPDPKASEVVKLDDEATITIYKDGQEKQILESDFGLYEAAGWSRVKPGTAGAGADPEFTVEDTEEEVGPGQVVSDKLNEFNNVPQNSILIEAGGQLFLGYEVPGAYGQLYNGNPIFMLYEVLGNDVFEAGILTEGASPQINVSLGSLEDLNQYGIIVGGTDELTDDVEHPFIRFTENFEAGKRVNPWLNDTEINPNTGVTYQQEAIEFLAEQALEQWTPETTQVRYEGSDWYRKSTTAQKTWLTTLLTQPQQANQDIQDKQIEVKIAMEANGIASPPDALVNWVAEKAVTGMWTQVYTDQQIALLADPYKPGTRDTGMVNFIEGVGVGTLDRLTVGEKTVRDLYRRYLGPSLGNASDTEIAEKAGQLRSDPDAEEQLKAYLEQQRLAMFGNYTNPTLTYNDIVQPYKNLVNQVWGQEVDETQDWFIKMVQDNDIEKAYTTLREKGIDQGIERVQDQALNDLQRSIGQGQIAPQLGANT